MAEGIEKIGKRDVTWSYAATIVNIGAGVIIMPFMLNKLSNETIGIWTIFQTITLLVSLLDFGFRPSFARNLTYIFSGARSLKKEGLGEVEESGDINYALLKGTIHAMQMLYRWVALGIFVLLITGGSFYFIHEVLQKYSGDHRDALVAWLILIFINSYNLYTLYYDALLLGKGYVKRNQQITILGQTAYILIAIALIYCGFGLTAIVSAQLVSYLIRRILSRRVFFTEQIKVALSNAKEEDYRQILRTLLPNSLRVGFTQLGGFAITQSAQLIGSHFLSLADIAAYGITMQAMTLIARCGGVLCQTFIPRFAQCRAEKDYQSLRKYYQLSIAALLLTYLVGGITILYLGDWALELIKSNTMFLPFGMLCVILVFQLLEQNHVVASFFIMSANKVPFMWPSIISAAATIILLFLFLAQWQMGLWGLILAPGVVQLCYQNWRWPSMVVKELYR